MNVKNLLKVWGIALVLFTLWMMPTPANATSQWARETGLACNACHTVFPRLNAYGQEYLQNGYQLKTSHKAEEKKEGVFLKDVSHLLGFRLNMTPVVMETNKFSSDSGKAKGSQITIGTPTWIQFFVAGSIYNDVSFFSELEYASSSFKFNWFYFNFTNLMGTQALNFQVGNISPLEFASYPNRLPQLPNIKGEVFLIKSSGGNGEKSLDMSSARTGIQYYGIKGPGLLYLGASPGSTSNNTKNQFMDYWSGLVLKMPEGMIKGFDGSNLTIHYYMGTDTKNTGDETTTGKQKDQIKNKYTRLSPQINIRYNDKFDIQAAYIIAKDDNRSLVATGAKEFKYTGLAFEGGYMPNDNWHFGLHYDQYSSDDKPATYNYNRVVPAVTYIINQNIRCSVYWENVMKDKSAPAGPLSDKILINLRTMF